MPAPVSILADLSVFGSLGFSIDADFPSNPRPGMMWLKGGMLYAYVDMSGILTWFPLSAPQRVYIHRQVVPAQEWIINHGLTAPEFWYQIQDTEGRIMSAPLVRNTVNQATASFAAPVTGIVVVVAPSDLSVPQVVALNATFGGGTVVVNENGVVVNGSPLVNEAQVTEQVNSAVAALPPSGVTQDQVTTQIDTAIDGLARVATTGAYADLTGAPADESHFSTYRYDKDTNGVFTRIEYKRPNGTLARRSVLSGGTSPNYTTRTVTIFGADGSTVSDTVTFTLTYSGSDLVAEVANG